MKTERGPTRPASCPLWKQAAVFAACGFGLGFSPVAPGTAGALLGPAIVLGLRGAGVRSTALECLFAVLLAAAAVPLCDVAEKFFGRKDDRRIVADEFLTFPLCMLGLPCEPWLLATAFMTSRLFDILKPPPARQIQAWQGGLGIVADDAVSGLYSLAANHFLFWMAKTFIFRG